MLYFVYKQTNIKQNGTHLHTHICGQFKGNKTTMGKAAIINIFMLDHMTNPQKMIMQLCTSPQLYRAVWCHFIHWFGFLANNFSDLFHSYHSYQSFSAADKVSNCEHDGAFSS